MMKVKKIIKNDNQYPTEWKGGILSGGKLKIKENYCIVQYYVGKYVPECKNFGWAINPKATNFSGEMFLSKEKALEEANKFLRNKLLQQNKIKNMWRQIDDDRIEVQTNSVNFIMDLKNHPIIEKQTCHTKKNCKNIHIHTNINGVSTLVGKLLKPSIKGVIEYIDGNTLNLCESNIRQFGAVEIADCVKEKLNDPAYDFKMDHYKNTKNIGHPILLPKNIWILGKPAGTIFEKNGCWYARIVNSDKYASKTFRIENENKNSQYEEASSWLYNTSYLFGLTKNLIRILDNNHIEVQITKNQITKTNIELIPIIQQISICSTKSGNENSKFYAMAMIGRKCVKFHNLITLNKMTDHNDGDPLNNTLENLMPCTYSINNSNRHYEDEHMGHKSTDRNNRAYIMILIKIDKKMYPKYFYFTDNDQTDDDLKKIAFKFRQWVLYGIYDPIIKPYITNSDFGMISKHCSRSIKHIQSEIASFDDYFKYFSDRGYELDNMEKKIMYNLYKRQQINQIMKYYQISKNAIDIIYKIRNPDNNIDDNVDDNVDNNIDIDENVIVVKKKSVGKKHIEKKKQVVK